MKETGLSPEDFGSLMGVSGMTLRRWQTKPKQESIPDIYIPAIQKVCNQLLAQGKIQFLSPSVQALLLGSESLQNTIAQINLGLPKDFSSFGEFSSDQMLLGLSNIGTHVEKREAVEKGKKKVFSFKKIGKEWASRISVLWNVIHSNTRTPLDKLVAYGALFYLLTPIDFIPDYIPFFGLLDDFAILGLAVTHYSSK